MSEVIKTEVLGLNKPGQNTIVNIDHINANMDIIEKAIIGDTSVTAVQNAIYLMFNRIYPVGAIYITTSADNPATLFGGEWERIQDCVLVAAGGTFNAGETGGNAGGTHTLTTAELPAHTHGLDSKTGRNNKRYDYSFAAIVNEYDVSGLVNFQPGNNDDPAHARVGFGTALTASAQEDRWQYLSMPSRTAAEGGTQPVDIMPPYLTVNMWQRTALYEIPQQTEEETEGT